MLKQMDEWAGDKAKSQKRRISGSHFSPVASDSSKRFASSSDSTSAILSGANTLDNLGQEEQSEQQCSNCSSNYTNLYRGSSPVVISDWLQTFKAMPKEVQSDALKELVELCSPSHVKHLQNVIAPHFKRDFISCLPKEISLKIISYLSPKDLARASQLCKCWMKIAEDHMLWQEKCQQHSIKELFPPTLSRQDNWDICLAQGRKSRVDRSAPSLEFPLNQCSVTQPSTSSYDHPCSSASCSSSDFSMMTAEDGELASTTTFDTCYTRSKWKAIYLRNERIRKNWCKKRLTAACQLRGHDDHVITCVQLHGDTLVTGSDDNTVRVWSTATAHCTQVLIGHQGGVWTLQLSEEDKEKGGKGVDKVISGSTDRTVRIWNLKTGLLIHTLHGHTSTVRCMALKKHILVSGSRDSTIKVWNIKDGFCLRTLYGHIAAVRCVQFDGEKIISGGYDNKIIVWDVNTGAQKCVLEGHSNRVYSLLYESERGLIISGSLDTTIRVWDANTGECLQTLVGHQSLTSGMQLRDNILVSANADSTIKVWNILDGQCLHTLSGNNRHSSAVTSLQFLENGLVATSGDDGFVKLWDVKKGAFICDLVKLGSSGAGGCVWRLKATSTMLICACGSRNGTEDTKLILMDFDAPYP